MQKFIGWFKMPSFRATARQKLEREKRKLMEAQEGLMYAKSMVSFHSANIKHLESLVKEGTSDAR